uniref:ETFB lysine methyltransferase n=1 Tax=Oryza rufipogon TaxID=4529 RepID=A0A0E0PPG6_ORYRU
MLPLVRPGRAAPLLRRLRRRLLLLSSPQTPSPSSSPYSVSSSKVSPLLLLLSARPSPSRAGDRGAWRGVSSCGATRAVDVGDEAASSSGSPAAAGSDLSSPYLSVRIRCRKEDAEVLSESLLCFGATSVTVDDIAAAGNLDEITITSIFAHGEDVGSCVSSAASSAGLEYNPVYESSVGKQCDWVTVVQETYESTKVIDGLWVIPKWRTPPDPQAINIIINPGLAFGTGEHPTTKLCLLLLRETVKGGERFLDYGTGTGVLGIAALKMGAALSNGIDIDPQAVTSACENMMPTGNLELKSSKGSYDIVAANILLNPLLELVEDIVGYAKSGGIVAVSGILSEQVPKVEEAYSRYLENISVSEIDGWACLRGNRRA